MIILVTGAGGMVGRHFLADERAGAHVILAPRRAELDLTDAGACAAYVAREKPDLIVHLAAVVGGIQANIDAPTRFLADNLALGLNVLTAAQAAGVPRLINMGSSCMYPKDAPGLLTEDRLLSGPLEPTNEGYALAKIAIARLGQAMRRENPGAHYVTLIPPNLYGPFDHFDLVRSHLPPAAIMKVEAAVRVGDRTVEIWGDGTARREFMFAGDLADFLWRVHDRLETLPPILNVGVGEDHTVREYYEVVARAAGYDGAFVYNPAKPTGMLRKLLDVSGQRRLGWSPPTGLEDGIAATLAYYRSVATSAT
jgi:GDP-L-fucose synthase